MSNRDDFSKKVRDAVALRASHRCSYRGCGRHTSGPSEESSSAVARIGVAAHIHAAAPLGKRYLQEMTPAERSSIDNSIWLCGLHGTLIDQDERRFPAALLFQMKQEHEEAVAAGLAENTHGARSIDLIALGPDTIFLGEFNLLTATDWCVSIDHFVSGGFGSIIKFIEQFSQINLSERYILVNGLGDGRVLCESPTLTKSGERFSLNCKISPRFPRIPVQKLGGDLKLGPTHDLVFENGDIAIVSGVDALPQKIMLNLSLQKGEMHFHPEAGVRLSDYYILFKGSPWLGRLIKLEVIRSAAIPMYDTTFKREYLPLECVESVSSVLPLSDVDERGYVVMRFKMVVNGLDDWETEMPIFVQPTKLHGAPDGFAGRVNLEP